MARRREGVKRRLEPAPPSGAPPLREGIYEHLVTEALGEELRRTLEAPSPPQAERAPLDAAEAPFAVARHLAAELERAIARFPIEERAERARALTASVLAHLAEQTGADGDEAEAIRAQELEAPPHRLLSLYRGHPPPRPRVPLTTSTLFTRNHAEPSLGQELALELALADRVDAILAFITVGGVNLLEPALRRFANRPGTSLRVLTTVYSGTTELAALDRLARLPGAEVKVSYDTRRTRLHAKAWLFHRASGLSTAYVGSANFTHTALGAGHEWTIKVSARDLAHVLDKFAGTFATLWEDPEFELYRPDSEASRERLRRALSAPAAPDARDDAARFLVTLHPLPFQAELLDRLAAERALHRRTRNLVVAATGTGKTVIAALDYARQAAAAGDVPPRLLFIAHREELLRQARQTFRHALNDPDFGALLIGGAPPRAYEHLFASIQSVVSTKLLERFGPDYYRYVVIDECHHAPAASYRAVLEQLQPEILLGLTATPERSDGQSLLPDFGGRAAVELRLWHALNDQLLVPFEYYGIADGVDLKQVRWSRAGYDAAALEGIYTGDAARAELIRHQLARHVADVRQIRALGFCVSVAHAEYMAAQFAAAGIPALAVHGASPDELRRAAPRRLREREVNVLFTCDLYNEGVDLPFVDTLLFLRPTQSATLFMQQLGRGLRHFGKKASCLVLDFIGQHRAEFRFDATLSALTGIPRAKLRKAVEEGFPYLPSGCALTLGEVARDEILRSLRTSLAGAGKLVSELRELKSPSLRSFLDDTGRELDEVYDAGGWTALKRKAGLLEATADAAAVDDLSRRLGRLVHIDEPARLRTYRSALREPAPSWDAADRLRFHMLDHQLNHRGLLRDASATVQAITAHPAIRAELRELCDLLEDRIGLAEEHRPVPEWPLCLHRHYHRREIVAAVGFIGPGDRAQVPQGGVLKLEQEGAPLRELLFVTLDKSGKSFSPTTRYRDYAVSPQLFHWETQAAASVSRPSGRRYLESELPGNPAPCQFFLFVRPDPDAPYAFLGRVRYQRHSGDRPIAIVWKLERSMPAALYEQYQTLRV